MKEWRLGLMFGFLAFIIVALIDLRKAVSKVQKQVEHLHNVMLDELENARAKVSASFSVYPDIHMSASISA